MGRRGANFHRAQLDIVKKHGRISRLDLGPHPGIAIADARFVQDYYKVEDAFPMRMPPNAWRECAAGAGLAPGLITAQGAEWAFLRKSVQFKVLRLDEVSAFGERLGAVSTDLVGRLAALKKTNGLVSQLSELMRLWAFEGMCTVAYDERVGCLERTIPKQTLEFIAGVAAIRESSFNSVGIFPGIHRVLNTAAWRRTTTAWTTVADVSMRFIQKKLEATPAVSDCDPHEETLLGYLVSKSQLTRQQVLALLTDFLAGGVDTVSNSVCFAFYNLAKNPCCQERLHTEICNVVGSAEPTLEHFRRMPYLKNCVKESLRVFPIVSVSGRNTTEDKVVDGLHIPKGTSLLLLNYAMCHDPDYFEQPEAFIPERWSRDGSTSDVIPFSALPFGHGVRSCIGRRLAELQMYFALTKVLQHYELRQETSIDLKTLFAAQLTAVDPLPVLFIDR